MSLTADVIIYNGDDSGSLLTQCGEAGWTVNRFDSLEEFVSNKGEGPAPLLILSIPQEWDEKEYENAADSFSRWHEAHPGTQLFVLTPKSNENNYKASVDFGARNTLVKPYESEDLFKVLSRIAQGIGARLQKEALDKANRCEDGFSSIIGISDPIKDVIELGKKVAASESTSIMITGENGTGKGAIAKAVHLASDRAEGPFIEVNCAAIPKSLLESEFFGHEKGAFTDAKQRKIGLFECANGGTIFLDEVGEIDYKLQAKLLKFLDSRTIRRISGTQFLPVDVRIISATNRNLKKDVEENRFRADLFYRLNVVEIKIPPLRDRVEDIEPIARYYTELFSSRLNKGKMTLTGEALEILEAYSWPGNIRELINIIERAVLLNSSGNIEPADLPIEASRETITNISNRRGNISIDLPHEGIALEDIEKGVIMAALNKTGGNIAAAARFLRLERGTLRYKMKKYGIKVSQAKKNYKIGGYEPFSITN